MKSTYESLILLWSVTSCYAMFTYLSYLVDSECEVFALFLLSSITWVIFRIFFKIRLLLFFFLLKSSCCAILLSSLILSLLSERSRTRSETAAKSNWCESFEIWRDGDNLGEGLDLGGDIGLKSCFWKISSFLGEVRYLYLGVWCLCGSIVFGVIFYITSYVSDFNFVITLVRIG